MVRFKGIFLSCLVLIFCGQCKVADQQVMVPGYVYIPYYKVATNADGSQGDSTSKVVDAWIYNNGSLEGAPGFPALLPIQKSGPTTIGVDAGILKTGQALERMPYPLFSRQNFSVNLAPNEVDTVIPVFKYSPSCTFKLIEDFDGNGFRFSYRLKLPGDTVIPITGDSAINPVKKSGLVKLTTQTDLFSIETTDWFTLEGFGIPSFIEIDYNSEVMLYIGVYCKDGKSGNINAIPMLNAYPTNGWNKAYIDLTGEVSNKPEGSQYKIYINIQKTPGGPSPKILLDNIKLIQG